MILSIALALVANRSVTIPALSGKQLGELLDYIKVLEGK